MGLVEACELQCECSPRIATAFRAGMGGHGEVCGALVGALMAFGLKFGRDRAEDTDAQSATSERAGKLLQEFADEFGSVRCIDLTGCDMRTAEGSALAQEKDLRGAVCPEFVVFVAEKAQRLLDR